MKFPNQCVNDLSSKNDLLPYICITISEIKNEPPDMFTINTKGVTFIL